MVSTNIAWYMMLASYMLHDHRQSSLKALLNTFGTHYKTHTMTTGYRNHDTEDVPAPKDSAPWTFCHQTTLCLNKTVNHLSNTVRKLTPTIPRLSYENNSNNFRSNLPIWNLKPTHPHTWQSSHSLLINFKTSL